MRISPRMAELSVNGDAALGLVCSLVGSAVSPKRLRMDARRKFQ